MGACSTRRVFESATRVREANGSYGLTTLRNRHVRFVRAGRLLFRFRGKGGAEHEVVVDDERLSKDRAPLQHFPTATLSCGSTIRGSAARSIPTRSNQYLGRDGRPISRPRISAPGSRPLRAITLLCSVPLPKTPASARQSCIVAVIKTGRRRVAQYTRGLPQVVHQSARIRNLAQRRAPQGDSRRHRVRAAQGRAASARVSAAKVQPSEPPRTSRQRRELELAREALQLQPDDAPQRFRFGEALPQPGRVVALSMQRAISRSGSSRPASRAARSRRASRGYRRPAGGARA